MLQGRITVERQVHGITAQSRKLTQLETRSGHPRSVGEMHKNFDFARSHLVPLRHDGSTRWFSGAYRILNTHWNLLMKFTAFAVGTFRVSAAHAILSMASTEFHFNTTAANMVLCAFPAGSALRTALR
jgi:hypothetical protein